jgi:hypothetical protein
MWNLNYITLFLNLVTIILLIWVLVMLNKNKTEKFEQQNCGYKANLQMVGRCHCGKLAHLDDCGRIT